MANYETIRDQIVLKLREVEGIGNVYKSERYVNDWPAFVELNAVTNLYNTDKKIFNVIWINRAGVTENDQQPYGTRDQAQILMAVNREERWQMTLFYGFHDDPDQPSEAQYQELVDNILVKFRWLEQFGLPTIIQISHPAVVETSGLFMLGDQVLVHRAVMVLRLVQRFDKVTT